MFGEWRVGGAPGGGLMGVFFFLIREGSRNWLTAGKLKVTCRIFLTGDGDTRMSRC